MNIRIPRIAPAVALLATLLLAACPDDLTGPEGGPPVGRYTCHYFQYSQSVTAGHLISILSGGRYQYYDQGTGTYGFDPQTTQLEWRSGPFAGSGVIGEFYNRSSDGRPTIKLSLPAGGIDHQNRPIAQTTYCIGPAQ